MHTFYGVLQQHFRDAGCGAEVTVNLERRVGAEQVLIDTSCVVVHAHGGDIRDVLCLFQQPIGAFPVPQACPACHFPGTAPAGSTVASGVERGFGGIRISPVDEVRDLPAGVEGNQMTEGFRIQTSS